MQETSTVYSQLSKRKNLSIPLTSLLFEAFLLPYQWSGISHRISARYYPGKSWVHRFVKRHKDQLTSEFLSGQGLSRKKADNIYQYERYFDLVQSLIPLRFSANIYSLLRKFPNTISSHTTPIIWMRKAS
jgi:hypothetical protein